MAQAKNVSAKKASAIQVLKTSIAALEKQIAEMKTATNQLALSQGLPPVYVEPRSSLPTLNTMRQELPSGDFRLDVGHSFASDHQD